VIGHSLRFLSLTTAVALWTATAAAQTAPTMASTQAPAATPDDARRPATTTFYGDTGLWFVPTAEVVPHGRVSVSGYRRGTNYVQGFSNVADFAGTFAFGVKDRAEIFGSFLFDTRIDRDLRPLFISDAKVGGVLDRYPRVTNGWSGDNVGDFYLGAKINLWSQYRQNPAAIAVRLMSKLPTGKEEAGVSTGKTDFSFDFIAAGKQARRSTSRRSPATSCAASPRASTRQVAQCGGAPAPASRRAARCARRSKYTACCPTPTT
jgi:hypothetical protein